MWSWKADDIRNCSIMNCIPNVLIVDDNIANLEFLEIILKKLKLNLIKAESGFEALEKTKDLELALAILDIWMPEMNGYELALKLNEERSEDKVPVIFVTANRFNEIEVFKGYDSGAVDYIFKPVSPNIILGKVRVFIDLFKQKQRIVQDAALLKKTADELTIVNAALKKSDNKYRSYIDNAPDGVFITDETVKFIEVNNAACRKTGYTKDQFLKMQISDFLPEESIKTSMAQFKQLSETGSFKTDLLYKHKNGTKRWLAVEAIKLNEKRFLFFAKDITNIKLAQMALMDSEVKFRTLFETMIHGVVHQDENGKIISANPAAERILGLSLDQMQGRSSIDPRWRSIHENGTSFPGDKHPAMIALKTGKSVSNEIMGVFNPKIEENRWINICAIPQFNSGEKKPFQVYSTFEDITDRMQAEEEHRTIIKTAMDGFMMLDIHGRFLEVNNAYCNLLGYSQDELLKMGINDVEVSKNLEETNRHLHKVIKIGYERFETQQRCKDGSIINAEISVNFEPSKAGRFYAFVRDITERKMVEKAIKLSEKKYKTLLNASPDGILLINLKGIIIEVSEIGLELFSANTRNDLVGKHFFRFVPSDEITEIREIIEKTINEGLAQNIGLKVRKKNESLFTGEISSTLIQGTDGMPISFMIIIRDVTQRKKLEKHLIHTERMAGIGEMATGIAHEINQPLNTISLCMDNVLASVKSNSYNNAYLEIKANKIFDNVFRMRNIIDHVRTFSRDHDDCIPVSFNINESINNALSMISEQFRHKGIQLVVNLDRKIGSPIGNTYKFEQVILNLLSNAKDAIEEKKRKLKEDFSEKIEIKSSQFLKTIYVEVKDNGVGIDPDETDNIMLPFYTTKNVGEGTGLGLSISFGIIKEMGGSIEIQSKIDEGTVIRIALPCGE